MRSVDSIKASVADKDFVSNYIKSMKVSSWADDVVANYMKSVNASFANTDFVSNYIKSMKVSSWADDVVANYMKNMRASLAATDLLRGCVDSLNSTVVLEDLGGHPVDGDPVGGDLSILVLANMIAVMTFLAMVGVWLADMDRTGEALVDRNRAEVVFTVGAMAQAALLVRRQFLNRMSSQDDE